MFCTEQLWRATLATVVVALLVACGGGSGSTAVLPSSPAAAKDSNVIDITVDAGPAGSSANVNRLYTTLKICQSGTSQCQSIDHVLVDTGSVGVRLLASALAAGLQLNQLRGSTGLPLLNCTQFVDNTFAWGPVRSADVVLGGKTALNLPIQVMGDAAFDTPPPTCASGATAMTSAAALGANGILGVGLFQEDCGSNCATSPHSGFYYTCTDASCTSTKGAVAALTQQVKNPVVLFASDNNGILLDLPAATSPAASLRGSLIFGIGTRANNQFASGSVLTTDSWGYVTSVLAGQRMDASFFDTGSNGLFFDSATLPDCAADVAAGFYCPPQRVSLTASVLGANARSASVDFMVESAAVLFADSSKTVLPGLSGPMADTSTFDWGLPFFYGRRVFLGLEGKTSPLGLGPYYAF